MGAAESALVSADAAAVDVALEQNEYYAGDIVRGYVQAHVKRAIPCRGIFVELDCEALTVVQLDLAANGNNARLATQRADALQPVSIQVAPGSKDRVVPGTYQIPFEFLLPKGAPATMELSSEHAFYARTALTIRIRFRSAKKKDSVVKTYRLRVFNKPRGPLRPLPLRTQRRVRACLGCLSRGLVDLRVELDRDAYQLGEVIRAKFEVSNLTSLAVKQAELLVVESYEVSANGHRRFAAYPGRAHVSALSVPAQHEQQGEMTAAFQFLLPSVDTPTVKVSHAVVFRLRLAGSSGGDSLVVQVEAPVLAYGYHKDSFGAVQPTPRQRLRDSGTPFRTKPVKLELGDAEVQPVPEQQQEPEGAWLAMEASRRQFAVASDEVLVAEPIDWVPDAQVIEASAAQFTTVTQKQ